MRVKTLTKQQIKQEAIDIINTMGLSKLSIRTLASKCNVTAGTVYLYYKDKGELITEIASDFWKECFKDLITADSFIDEIEQNYNHLSLYLNKFRQNFISSFANVSYGGDSAKSVMKTHKDMIRSFIKERLLFFENSFVGACYKKIGSDYMIDFIFTNLMSALYGENDFDKFVIILKNILFGG